MCYLLKIAHCKSQFSDIYHIGKLTIEYCISKIKTHDKIKIKTSKATARFSNQQINIAKLILNLNYIWCITSYLILDSNMEKDD